MRKETQVKKRSFSNSDFGYGTLSSLRLLCRNTSLNELHSVRVMPPASYAPLEQTSHSFIPVHTRAQRLAFLDEVEVQRARI